MKLRYLLFFFFFISLGFSKITDRICNRYFQKIDTPLETYLLKYLEEKNLLKRNKIIRNFNNLIKEKFKTEGTFFKKIETSKGGETYKFVPSLKGSYLNKLAYGLKKMNDVDLEFSSSDVFIYQLGASYDAGEKILSLGIKDLEFNKVSNYALHEIIHAKVDQNLDSKVFSTFLYGDLKSLKNSKIQPSRNHFYNTYLAFDELITYSYDSRFSFSQFSKFVKNENTKERDNWFEEVLFSLVQIKVLKSQIEDSLNRIVRNISKEKKKNISIIRENDDDYFLELKTKDNNVLTIPIFDSSLENILSQQDEDILDFHLYDFSKKDRSVIFNYLFSYINGVIKDARKFEVIIDSIHRPLKKGYSNNKEALVLIKEAHPFFIQLSDLIKKKLSYK